jgi:Fe-S oxidoreductase
MGFGRLINRFNQFLAFSPLYAKTWAAESVFWPGCAAARLSPELLSRAFLVLRKYVPDLGFSGWCCGKPTLAIGSGGKKRDVLGRLEEHFARSGIRRIYALCPNCLRTLRENFEPEALSAWTLLARGLGEEKEGRDAGRGDKKDAAGIAGGGAFPSPGDRGFILHDPCTARGDREVQRAAREIMAASGVPFGEFEHAGDRTRCCGRADMLFLTDERASASMLRARIGEARGMAVVSCCESCVAAFRSAGHPGFHLLEIMFGLPSGRGSLNRIRNVRRRLFRA